MNLDKKLAKYARQLDNPKYFGDILEILETANKTKYTFKDFNEHDLQHIASEIDDYYQQVNTPEKNRQIIEYCNDMWFVVSDKHYILIQTKSLFIALSFYIRAYFLLHLSKILQTFSFNTLISANNVNNHLYLIKGALKVSKIFGCSIFDLNEYYLEDD